MEWVWYKEDGHERIAEGLSEERRERIERQRERERERGGGFSSSSSDDRSRREGTARVRTFRTGEDRT
jgi:hypothetical protein